MKIISLFVSLLLVITVLLTFSSSSSFLCFVQAQVPSSYFVNATTSCMASLKEPVEPRPLEFCYWQNAKACCTPANDASAKASFQAFTDLGPGCAPTDHKIRAAYREVHQFACLPCHPREPDFRVDARIGDTHLLGGQVEADPNATEGTFKWRVCLSFVFGKDGKSGLWGTNGSKFDKCGIRPQGGTEGFDFTIPSVAFANDNLTVLAESFVKELPSFISGFQAVIVNDSHPDFDYNRTPCFASVGQQPFFISLVVAAVVLLVSMII